MKDPVQIVPGFLFNLVGSNQLIMTEITGEEFKRLLRSDSKLTIDKYLIFDEEFVLDISDLNSEIKFRNCTFKGRLSIIQDIKSKDLESKILSFENCAFENVIINKCKFSYLSFNSITASGTIFSISESEIEKFEMYNSIIENQTFIIHHCSIQRYFSILKVKTIDGSFSLRKNKFSNTEALSKCQISITSCQLFNCDISGNNFEGILAFTNNILSYENTFSANYFEDCTFNSSSFGSTDFGPSTLFKNCTFNENTLFDYVGNEQHTDLKFKNCRFKSSTSFRKARIHKLNLSHSIFENSTIFQDAYFDIIKLDNSFFEKNVLFDDVQIKQIDQCDRRTIRNIKLHLQKTENKIDYNRFRVYEFEAYKKDLRKQIVNYKNDTQHFYHRKREIKHFKRDLFILNITGFFSEYGTDWKRALKCTLLTGMLFYSILYFFEFYVALNLNNDDDFSSGAFRFFLVTDFFSPFLDRKYLNNGYSWTIFVLGKIFIAFGIYEMIQAFRKFKA